MRIALFATLALVASTVLAGPDNKNKKPHQNNALVINKRVLRTSTVPFIPHTGNATFTNWVGLNVDFKYIQPVFQKVNSTLSLGNGTLISRGESHITVILPPEYDNILKKCLGRVQAVTQPGNVFQQSVQLIVKNYKDILAYRQDVFKLFVKKGGNPALFAAENYQPHLTLGFKNRDLFVEDGVFKGKNACFHKVQLK
ncbi:hypothetical protein BGX23_011667 [Mortierella sp. AD031]|nr:hypothetical protein BGX23_011667 [Mortierella sp. AD031]